MKRAAAFFIASVAILLLSLLITGGRSILCAGILAMLVGLVFAASPLLGMRIVGVIVCTPIVMVEITLGLLSGAVWLTACSAVVFVPPTFGFLGFLGTRRGFGDVAAVVFLLVFITAWLAARKMYRNAIRRTSQEVSDLLKDINRPVEEARSRTFEYFNSVGKWMTE
jgi:hypothetical protein